MDRKELITLQSLPLDIKILKTKQRIREAIELYGVDGLYISFSGGKDSIVLRHLLKEFGIKSVYCKTGLEYPSVDKIGMSADIVIKPKMHFTDVLTKYGYPCISKEQSQFIYQYRTAKSQKTKDTRINGNSAGRGKISTKWLKFIRSDFMISDKCCDVMKKRPFKKFEKDTDSIPILGIMADESQLRLQNYLKNGCNAFDSKRPKSTPIGFWIEQDVLQYIKDYNLEIPKVYGDIVSDLIGNLSLTGEPRTGCIFCLYGCHLDNFSKIEYLRINEPKLYDYCMRGGKYNEFGYWVPDKGLGLKHVIKQLKGGE